ncbi:MAG: Zn-ribbon domain-containing OB-fold protein [Spongiibacteraceae bacterium]
MQIYAENGRPLPLVTPLSQPFFAAAREQKLLLQKCPRDGFFFYPRSHCPHCLQTDWLWQPAKTAGKIHSFTIDRMGQDPGQRLRVPFVIAVIDLDEGPRMIGNVINCTPENLRVGMAVNVCFEIVDNMPLTCFKLV